MSNSKISEEIISGWRREFEDSECLIKWRYLLTKNQSGEYDQGDTFRLWSGFKMGKTSSHERILELENNVETYKAAFQLSDEKWQLALKKLTKRDELLKRSLLWNEAMLKIAIISIDEEKQRAEATSPLYQLVADIKQLEQEK